MGKYYLKHTNASGWSIYRRRTVWGVIGFILNLYTGESITIVRSGGDIEMKLHNQPPLFEEL